MDQSLILIMLGALFLAGLVADSVGRRAALPRGTLLIGFGVLAGQSGFDLIGPEIAAWFETLSTIALSLVAFLLGGVLTRERLAVAGREILTISVMIVLVSVLVVTLGLVAIGTGLSLALILGAMAAATDPITTQDAIDQTGGGGGKFGAKLKAIVAIDDAFGLLVFSLVIALAHGLNGAVELSYLNHVVWEIGGAAVLGVALGLPGAYLTGRVKKGESLQSEALGLVFLTAGLAIWLGVSFLIATLVAGIIVANFARRPRRAFHEIERIHWPIMVLFFLLAGASLDIGRLPEIGLLGVAYVVLRIVARITGGWLGARLGRAPAHERAWFGPALMPQAGIAVGMALIAGQAFPDMAETILTLTIGAIVVFELIGPIGTLYAVRRVKAASKSKPRNL